MLARERRLRRARDINRVYSKGRFGGAAGLSVKVLSSGLPTNRAAVIVSRKVSKKAVVRNRIRRRLMAILADIWARLSPSCDIVVTVRSDIAELPALELKKQLETALTKAGALKN